MITCSVRTAGDLSRVLIEEDGHAVAAADVIDDGGQVLVQFVINYGHLPIQVRRQLVDAAFTVPALTERRAVRATVPMGDF